LIVPHIEAERDEWRMNFEMIEGLKIVEDEEETANSTE
jgi:hypothetical protein